MSWLRDKRTWIRTTACLRVRTKNAEHKSSQEDSAPINVIFGFLIGGSACPELLQMAPLTCVGSFHGAFHGRGFKGPWVPTMGGEGVLGQRPGTQGRTNVGVCWCFMPPPGCNPFYRQKNGSGVAPQSTTTSNSENGF